MGNQLTSMLSCRVYQTVPRILDETTFYILKIPSGQPETYSANTVTYHKKYTELCQGQLDQPTCV